MRATAWRGGQVGGGRVRRRGGQVGASVGVAEIDDRTLNCRAARLVDRGVVWGADGCAVPVGCDGDQVQRTAALIDERHHDIGGETADEVAACALGECGRARGDFGEASLEGFDESRPSRGEDVVFVAGVRGAGHAITLVANRLNSHRIVVE